MLADPSGKNMGLQTVWLRETMVKDFYYPGLFLTGVFGFLTLFVTVGMLFDKKWSWYAQIMLGEILMSWIIYEALIVPLTHTLQLVSYVGGLAMVIIGFLSKVRNHYIK